MVARNDGVPGQPDRWAGHREPRNHLLEMLSPQDWASVEPLLERVEIAVSETLELSGEVSPWLHFPESAIVSIVTTLADGRRVEVGTVGNEGMCGLSAWHEAESDDSQAICTMAGACLRGRASDLIAATVRRPAIRRLLNRYAGAYITLVAQSMACRRMHGLEQRCARSLLMTHDRMSDGHLRLSRDRLAAMLGVPPAGATLAVRTLRGHGLITVSRDRVDIVDRAGLEQMSCECYHVVRAHFANLA